MTEQEVVNLCVAYLRDQLGYTINHAAGFDGERGPDIVATSPKGRRIICEVKGSPRNTADACTKLEKAVYVAMGNACQAGRCADGFSMIALPEDRLWDDRVDWILGSLAACKIGVLFFDGRSAVPLLKGYGGSGLGWSGNAVPQSESIGRIPVPRPKKDRRLRYCLAFALVFVLLLVLLRNW